MNLNHLVQWCIRLELFNSTAKMFGMEKSNSLAQFLHRLSSRCAPLSQSLLAPLTILPIFISSKGYEH